MKKPLLAFLLVGASLQSIAQNLLEGIEQDTLGPPVTQNIFKGTRLINGHSVEIREKGVLEFIISHRFGEISSGSYNLYGLDESNIRFGLEYAPIKNLYAGIGRSSFEKTFDGFLKFRSLMQRRGHSPVAITLFGSTTIKTLKNGEEGTNFSDKLAYTGQLIIARKFSPGLSIQVMPTFIHFNTIKEDETRNDVIALGVGGRIGLTRRMAIELEYYYQLNELSPVTYNSFAVGIEIETGGHVFQIQLTNARSMLEKGFIAESRSDFFAGDIRLGFNISRAFQLTD